MTYAGQPLQLLGSQSQDPGAHEEELLLSCEDGDPWPHTDGIGKFAKRRRLYSIVATAGFFAAATLLCIGAVRLHHAIESDGHLPTLTDYTPLQRLVNGQWYWKGKRIGLIERGRYLVLDAHACHIKFNASRHNETLDASIQRKRGDCNSPIVLKPVIGQPNTFSCPAHFGGGGGTVNSDGDTIVWNDGAIFHAFKGDVGVENNSETPAVLGAPGGIGNNTTDELAELAALIGQDNGINADKKKLSMETVGFIIDSAGKCLTLLDTSVAGNAVFEAVMMDCDWASLGDRQRWVLDGSHLTIRSSLMRDRCLQASSFRTSAVVSSARCNPLSTGQIWTLGDSGIMTTQQTENKTNITWCGVPSSATGALVVQQSHDNLVLTPCASKSKSITQSFKWKFAGMNQIALQHGLGFNRPLQALIAEGNRREVARADHNLLTLDDVAWVADTTHLLNHSFWPAVQDLLQSMTPDWGNWQELISHWTQLGKSEPKLAPIASAMLANLLSNMVFAGTNFVHGSNGKNLNVWGTYQLSLQSFTSLPLTCGSGKSCTWQIPNYSETVNITSIAEFASDLPVAKDLLANAAFRKLYTGKQAPAWESHVGQDRAFEQVAAGVAAARKAGLEPSAVAANSAGRFAFDLEGILFMLGEGFGWYDLNQTQYASNGAFGAALVEQYLAKDDYFSGDVLGFIMTESALSMHLEALGPNSSLLQVNLSALERYAPLPGFARLGGQAVFTPKDGRLKTVLLQYGGHTYTNFSDPRSDADFAKNKLSGWRFAEKAIIASLLAKTQLLTHVKLIHMELAPVLQAVTTNLPDHSGHRIKMMLEPFIQRSIQATNNNIKAWFEFRAGEFGFAPLPMEEQAKLLADALRQHPVNLSNLDMENYAQARGMQKHVTMQGRRLGSSTWQWKWHHRALQVQRKYKAMIRNWIQYAYQGNDFNLQADAGLRLWWVNMFKHMPALSAAAKGSWLPNVSVKPQSSQTIDDPFAGLPALPPMEISIPKVPAVFIPPLTTIRFTTTTTTTTTAATKSTTVSGGWYVPVSALKQPAAPVSSKVQAGYTSIFKLPQPGISPARRMQPAAAASTTASEASDSISSTVGSTTASGTAASSIPTTATPTTTSTVAAAAESSSQSSGTTSSEAASVAATSEAASTMASTTSAAAEASAASAAATAMTISSAAAATHPANRNTSLPQKGSASRSTLGNQPEQDLSQNQSGNENSTKEGVNFPQGPEASDDLNKSSARNEAVPEDGPASLNKTQDNKDATTNGSSQGNSSAASATFSSKLIPLPDDVPELGVESLVRVLSTLLVWVSWVHEDVGHASAAFVYNPVHTPGFVPSDGRGIPVAALAFRVAAFRSFVALERPKLFDRASDMLFANHTRCTKSAKTSFTSCRSEVSGEEVLSLSEFQSDMGRLKKSDATFQACDDHGLQHSFFSCTDDVESSASS